MLIEINDTIIVELHQKKDWMKQMNCAVVLGIKYVLDDTIKESVGYTVLWIVNENYVVKRNESSFSVNIKHRNERN